MDPLPTYERTLQFLQGSSPEARLYATDVLLILANKGNNEALDKLIEALTDRDTILRVHVISVIGKLEIYKDILRLNKYMTIWTKLMRALEDDLIEVRTSTDRAIKEIIGSATPMVLRRLKEHLQNPTVISNRGSNERVLRLVHKRLDELKVISALRLAGPNDESRPGSLTRLTKLLIR